MLFLYSAPHRARREERVPYDNVISSSAGNGYVMFSSDDTDHSVYPGAPLDLHQFRLRVREKYTEVMWQRARYLSGIVAI